MLELAVAPHDHVAGHPQFVSVSPRYGVDVNVEDGLHGRRAIGEHEIHAVDRLPPVVESSSSSPEACAFGIVSVWPSLNGRMSMNAKTSSSS